MPEPEVSTPVIRAARAGQALVVHRDHADLRMRALDPGEISAYLGLGHPRTRWIETRSARLSERRAAL